MKDQGKLLSGLYLVATPLGNLEDLSYRAVRVLQEADWLGAEDTRESAKLLDSQGLKRPELISFHEHSGPEKISGLIDRLKRGEVGAYVSDAGTPGICDPGAELVKAAVAAGVKVYPVPGPSAPIALLSVSGFAASEFSFHGFFPREKRKAFGKKLSALGGVHVFFESPHRIKDCLEFLREAFPEAKLVVGRELTKKFETITHGKCLEVAELLLKEEPRGEYVLALDLGEAPEAGASLNESELNALLAELASLGANQKILVRVGMSHGLAKNAAYALALETLKK